jgi:hypothetical protein
MSETYISRDEADEIFENALEFLTADDDVGTLPGPASEETDGSGDGCLPLVH